jgi:hypothetical protein
LHKHLLNVKYAAAASVLRKDAFRCRDDHEDNSRVAFLSDCLASCHISRRFCCLYHESSPCRYLRRFTTDPVVLEDRVHTPADVANLLPLLFAKIFVTRTKRPLKYLHIYCLFLCDTSSATAVTFCYYGQLCRTCWISWLVMAV